MSQSNTHLGDRIWFQQTRNTVVVALIVGILMSLATILLDLQAERKDAFENAQQIVSILQRPATQAAFNIDPILAKTVVQSLLEYRIIYQARIIDDLGQDLAIVSHEQTSGVFDALSEWLFGTNLVIERTLDHRESGQIVGHLEITIDTHLLAQNFFQRSQRVIVGGLIRNILLAAVLLFLFHKTLGKPVLALISDVSAVNPAEPVPSLRTPRSHEKTELGQLTARLNHLLSVLNDSQIAQKQVENDLRIHQAELEQTVAERTAELRQANTELAELATTDSLTAVCNRRAFNDQAQRELERSKRQARDAAILMIDLDHFKSINDNHGHATGDHVLQQVASEIAEHIRQGDIFGRIGGEEFSILLHDIDVESATLMAERIRTSLQKMDVRSMSGQPLQLSASIGLSSTRQQHSYDLVALMHCADQALYQAKDQGRNRVVIATGPENNL